MKLSYIFMAPAVLVMLFCLYHLIAEMFSQASLIEILVGVGWVAVLALFLIGLRLREIELSKRDEV